MKVAQLKCTRISRNVVQSSHTEIPKQEIMWNRLPHTSLERAEGKCTTDQYKSVIFRAPRKSLEVDYWMDK